jgi:hypothetical protein
MAAPPRHIFAMKARAARTRDIDDLRLLADIVGVESADAALQICANFYPGRTRIREIRRRAPRTIRLTTPASGTCPPRYAPG